MFENTFRPDLVESVLTFVASLIKGIGIYQTAILLLTIFVNVILAFAVYLNARRQRKAKRGLFLVGPFIRGLVVLVTSLLGVVAYWLIHHSTLRPRSNDSTE